MFTSYSSEADNDRYYSDSAHRPHNNSKLFDPLIMYNIYTTGTHLRGISIIRSQSLNSQIGDMAPCALAVAAVAPQSFGQREASAGL